MNIEPLRKTILTRSYARRFFTSFFALAGISLLVIDLFTRFGYIDSAPIPSEILILLMGAIVIGSLIYTRPRFFISNRLSSPDTAITIKVGDLFDEPGHLIIGMCDTFDIEIGDIIKKDSVQGQFLTRRYHNNSTQLDQELSQALTKQNQMPVPESGKTRGKSNRYPIGTTAKLGSGSQMYFCTAYGRMSNDLKANSTIEDLWISLNSVWSSIRLHGQGTKVSIPVIGSDLARSGQSHATLIQLIALSFITASKQEFITKELVIVVHPSDLHKVNMNYLEYALHLLCS